MDWVALGSRLMRRWWVVVGLAALAALGAATAGASKTDEHRTKIHFVLRPDASVTNDDLPGTLDALKSDGTLVQTVIGVLRNRAILRRAAADADVTLTPEYSVDSTSQPGSTLIDSTITGPDRSVLARLAAGYASEASIYVASSYSAYVLERLSTEPTPDGSGPGTGQVVILALLLGAALGVVLVAAELRLEPHVQRLSTRRAAERAARSRRGDPDGRRREARPRREPKREPGRRRSVSRGRRPRRRSRRPRRRSRRPRRGRSASLSRSRRPSESLSARRSLVGPSGDGRCRSRSGRPRRCRSPERSASRAEPKAAPEPKPEVAPLPEPRAEAEPEPKAEAPFDPEPPPVPRGQSRRPSPSLSASRSPRRSRSPWPSLRATRSPRRSPRPSPRPTASLRRSRLRRSRDGQSRPGGRGRTGGPSRAGGASRAARGRRERDRSPAPPHGP